MKVDARDIDRSRSEIQAGTCMNQYSSLRCISKSYECSTRSVRLEMGEACSNVSIEGRSANGHVEGRYRGGPLRAQSSARP